MRVHLLFAFSVLLVPRRAPGAGNREGGVQQGERCKARRPVRLCRRGSGTWQNCFLGGSGVCTSDQCEAGFTSGDLVVSVEHAKDFVRIIAGFKGCENPRPTARSRSGRSGATLHLRPRGEAGAGGVVKGLAEDLQDERAGSTKLEVAGYVPEGERMKMAVRYPALLPAFLLLSALRARHACTSESQLNKVGAACGLALGELFQDESEKRFVFLFRRGATGEERSCVSQLGPPSGINGLRQRRQLSRELMPKRTDISSILIIGAGPSSSARLPSSTIREARRSRL